MAQNTSIFSAYVDKFFKGFIGRFTELWNGKRQEREIKLAFEMFLHLSGWLGLWALFYYFECSVHPASFFACTLEMYVGL